MSGLKFPPPPVGTALVSQDGKMCAHPWRDWFIKLQSLAAPASSSGTVNSVALAMPAIFAVSGSPIVNSGTLTATFNVQAANQFFCGPVSGAAVQPGFRALAYADLPALSITTLTFSAALSVPLTGTPDGAAFRCTLTGNTVITPTGGVDGQRFTLELKQDATGSRTVSFGAAVSFGTTVPSFTASLTAGVTDYINLIYNSASGKYRVISVSQGFA